MAVEDAASIAQILAADTPSDDVPERLKLYESIRSVWILFRGDELWNFASDGRSFNSRHERATWVQDQTRINGMDEDKRPEGEPRFFIVIQSVRGRIRPLKVDGLQRSRAFVLYKAMANMSSSQQSKVDSRCWFTATTMTSGHTLRRNSRSGCRLDELSSAATNCAGVGRALS